MGKKPKDRRPSGRTGRKPGKVAAAAAVHRAGLLSEHDLHLFNEGTHYRLYRKLGAHPRVQEGVAGTSFGVWAPNAKRVSVMGDFNGWDKKSHPLLPLDSSGIWEGFVPDVESGTTYKYHIESSVGRYQVDKADPFGFRHEVPPRTGSIVWGLDYDWDDADWLAGRARRNALDSPMSIYEVHLGSWMRGPDNRFLSYRELAPRLIEHLRRTKFTHVELLPVTEHPFYGSWGYQTTGYFAPTSRYGSPQDFMFLIDQLHQHGYGVWLDWVPSHFPTDEHGLGFFDGTHLFEHADPQQGFHPDWKSLIFNYARHEVRSFLISSALFWLDVFHIDGLRVDAVASMLYLDYSREADQWIPNKYGGRENLEAISFLRQLNEEAYRIHPDTQIIAEESTAWPMVSRPTYLGGLGFGMKWDMGWMHDVLEYVAQDPLFRRYRHNDLTFRMVYAFHENFVLPLSHDEVVHGKNSLIGRMPGDYWRRFANLRLLFGYMYGQPGKKLLFMGGEFGQWSEWDHEGQLDWELLRFSTHQGVLAWVADLNEVYRTEPSLHEVDFDPAGFRWVEAHDSDNSVFSFLRFARDSSDAMLVACNFTPVARHDYRLGVPEHGYWTELLNSDADHYGGSGCGNLGGVQTDPSGSHGWPYSLSLTLPPLSAVFLRSPRPGAEQ